MEVKHLLIGLAIFILIGIGIFKLGGLLVGSQGSITETARENSPPPILIIEEVKSIAEDANKRNQNVLDSLE